MVGPENEEFVPQRSFAADHATAIAAVESKKGEGNPGILAVRTGFTEEADSPMAGAEVTGLARGRSLQS